jgi:dienelactone hydrolase
MFCPPRIVRAPGFALSAALLSSLALFPTAHGAGPRVLPAGETPKDVRTEALKDLNGYFPFEPPATLDDWNKRAEQVRRRILVSQGLWPMPEKSPLKAVIHGKVDRPEYTVEKVYFESFPGFFVTGSLYRPKGKEGKLPGVLCPHGHWANGRFYDAGEPKAKKDIAIGAEKFEEGARSPLQARCVQLARMGCVAFHYDMLGYADSTQIPFELAHGFAKQRPDMNANENWGLFSPQAESNLQSAMGLQTWNSIRSLDFLLTLPEIDPKRLAVTGASGGGTQTMLLAGIDPRVAVSVPAVMVSTAMQGGCTCENASCLRVGAGNVEFAALFAPKPQVMTAANDWTKEMATKGFPDLKKLYGMYKAEDEVKLSNLIQFEHNYNWPNREVLYQWLNEHFRLGLPSRELEQDFKRLTQEELSVWDAEHPKPPGGSDFERKLLAQWQADAQKQVQAAAKDLAKFRDLAGPAIETLIGRTLPAAGEVEWEIKDKQDRGGWLQMAGLLNNVRRQEQLPVVFLHPKEWKGQVVIWLTDQGKEGLFAGETDPRPAIEKLLRAGVSVVGVDLIYQGEFLKDGQPLAKTRRVANPREAAAYTFGYNASVFAQRVQDVLSTIGFAQNYEKKPERIDLVGLGGYCGPIAAAARAIAKGDIARAAIDTNGFRFQGVTDLHDVDFLPGGAKYGDLPGMLALAAPAPVWLAGEQAEGLGLVSNSYKLAGNEKGLVLSTAPQEQRETEAVQYLLEVK